MSVFTEEFQHRVEKWRYRSRHALLYVVFGAVALGVEFTLRRLLSGPLPAMPAAIVAVACGIATMFALNVRFNFQVHRRWLRSLSVFAGISVGSLLAQWLLVRAIGAADWGYEGARLLVSGVVFVVAYGLHVRYSFRDIRQVGVAVYANGIEDIASIYRRIGPYPDFIHVDVVDETFKADAHPAATYRLETIRAYWPGRPVHVHLMTRHPSRFLPEVSRYADAVVLQVECDEELAPLVGSLRERGLGVGLCALMDTPLQRVRELLPLGIEEIMLLAIPQPGFSGQRFDPRAWGRIAEVNGWPERETLHLTVDGGVNEENISTLDVDRIVSGSAVLAAADPRLQILRLQSAGTSPPDGSVASAPARAGGSESVRSGLSNPGLGS